MWRQVGHARSSELEEDLMAYREGQVGVPMSAQGIGDGVSEYNPGEEGGMMMIIYHDIIIIIIMMMMMMMMMAALCMYAAKLLISIIACSLPPAGPVCHGCYVL